jgi:anti-anti-sigma regulatory factor
MAKESVWQRRARKCRSAKDAYYPKVDVTAARGATDDALAQLADRSDFDPPAPEASEAIEAEAAEAPVEALDPVVEAAAEEAPAAVEVEAAEPPVEILAPPVEAAADEAPAAVEAEAAEPPVEILAPPAMAAADAAPARAGAAPGETLRLPDCLDLPAAKPLAKALLERRGRPIVIDAASVSQLGAQCVQVLLSATRTWDADGVPLSIVRCAPRMLEDLRLLGIDSSAFTSGDQLQ